MHPDTAEFNETNFIEDIPQDLKLEMNNLVWLYGREDLTLGEAEKLSLYLCEIVKKGMLKDKK